jgi:hypothetical protein
MLQVFLFPQLGIRLGQVGFGGGIVRIHLERLGVRANGAGIIAQKESTQSQPGVGLAVIGNERE